MLIHVKIHPESRKDSLEAKNDNNFVVKVREKAENNAANRRMRQLLAEHFKVDLGKVKIVTGHHAPSKIIEIQNAK